VTGSPPVIPPSPDPGPYAVLLDIPPSLDLKPFLFHRLERAEPIVVSVMESVRWSSIFMGRYVLPSCLVWACCCWQSA
jgi:hypothetical protein